MDARAAALFCLFAPLACGEAPPEQHCQPRGCIAVLSVVLPADAREAVLEFQGSRLAVQCPSPGSIPVRSGAPGSALQYYCRDQRVQIYDYDPSWAPVVLDVGGVRTTVSITRGVRFQATPCEDTCYSYAGQLTRTD